MSLPKPDDQARDVRTMQEAARTALKALTALGETMDRRTPADYRVAGLAPVLDDINKIARHVRKQAD